MMIKDTASQDVILSKPKSRKTWLIVSIGLVAAVSFVAYPNIANWSSSERSINKSRFRMANVERGEFIRDLSLQGHIVAANSPSLYAPAIGTVTLFVSPGEVVNKGDIVAKVESPELTNRLQQEQFRLESLKIELERQKIATKQARIKSRQQVQLEKVILDAANREKRRAEKSVSIQVLSQLDYEKTIDDLKRSQLNYDFSIEDAKLEQENLSFELKTKEFELNQYQLLVDNTERLVKELELTAPVTGVVGSWLVEQKSAIALNQALLSIVDLSAFQVEVDIPEFYADTLGIGMPVKVNYNAKEYNASLISISPEVANNVIKGRVAFSAEPPAGIKQNQRVSSRAIIEQKENALYLPKGSFVQNHGGSKVFVVKDNVATLTNINLGARSIDKVEVVSGLTQGQKVIISNTDFVDGTNIINLN